MAPRVRATSWTCGSVTGGSEECAEGLFAALFRAPLPEVGFGALSQYIRTGEKRAIVDDSLPSAFLEDRVVLASLLRRLRGPLVAASGTYRSELLRNW